LRRADRDWTAADTLKNVVVRLTHPDGRTELLAVGGVHGDNRVRILQPMQHEPTSGGIAGFQGLAPFAHQLGQCAGADLNGRDAAAGRIELVECDVRAFVRPEHFSLIVVAGVDGVAVTAADTTPDVVPATSPCCTAAVRLSLVVAADAKFLLVFLVQGALNRLPSLGRQRVQHLQHSLLAASRGLALG